MNELRLCTLTTLPMVVLPFPMAMHPATAMTRLHDQQPMAMLHTQKGLENLHGPGTG